MIEFRALLAVAAAAALLAAPARAGDFIRYENCGELTRPSPVVEINGTQLLTFLPKGTRCPAGVACLGERLRKVDTNSLLKLTTMLRGLDQAWVTRASDWRKTNRIVDDAGCSQLTINGMVLYWETVWDPWDAESQRLYAIQRTFDALIVPQD